MQSNKLVLRNLFERLNFMIISEDVVSGAFELFCIILTGVSINLSTPVISMRVSPITADPSSS